MNKSILNINLKSKRCKEDEYTHVRFDYPISNFKHYIRYVSFYIIVEGESWFSKNKLVKFKFL